MVTARNISEITTERYDFVVCGSGSSGSVVARRLAENPQVKVLLLEAGGTDEVPAVVAPDQWFYNVGSERDWYFSSQPHAGVNHRSIPLSMGKVLGGGSSINVSGWARGHQRDWDFFAAEAADEAWSYASILEIYRRIEDWQGEGDNKYRGSGGPMHIEPARNPNPIAPAMVEAAHGLGMPTFASNNGPMMEQDAGAAIFDLITRDGQRRSVYRSYVEPVLDQANLTVLTGALVTRLDTEGHRVVGVEFMHENNLYHACVELEVILSLGAINTPKVLMYSGIGDPKQLRRHGIPVLQDLPGVGQNLQDHARFDCVWEYHEPIPPCNNTAEATFFCQSRNDVHGPDIQACIVEVPVSSPENAERYGTPEAGWTLCAALLQPKSRGRIELTGPGLFDPVRVEANTLADHDDVKCAITAVEICREVGNAPAMRAYAKREVMPGNLKGKELERFVRDAAMSYSHETCTAKMGRDSLSVVDSTLKVYGMEGLRIADGSIMPRVTTGNTMAPCVVIGERGADILKSTHGL